MTNPATNLEPLWENDKGFFNTVSRNRFNLVQPCASEIKIEDIAHALANLCRFGGHSCEYYSVAQHSVMVWSMAPPRLKKAALLHDASEAYLGDVIKPLKNLLGTNYAVLEYNVMASIGLKYGLTHEDFEKIKDYDKKAVEIEFDYFFNDRTDAFEGYFNSHENTCWTPTDAKAMFMHAYDTTFE